MKILDLIEKNKTVIETCLDQARLMGDFYPNEADVFNAFTYFENTEDIKVVILGQDPYHGKNEANGLAFSVNNDIKIPPSLRNIFKEIKRSYPNTSHTTGDLSYWAKQGVFLLNTILTVRPNKPASHEHIGWQLFTEDVIAALGKEKNKVFFLWGNKAIKYKKLIDDKQNLVLFSAHPSPLSANKGFLGNDHFIKANHYLIKTNKLPIDWSTK